MTARGREAQPHEGATDTEILGAAAAGIARRGHLTSGLAHALAACLRRPGISRCAIYLYGPGGLEPHVAEGFVGEDWLRFFDRKALFGSIADLGEPQFSRPGDGSPLPDTGVVSTAAFPIPGPAAHVGILVVGSDTIGLDAPDARAFLAAFAAVLGQACGMSLAMTELRAAERRYGLILGEAADAILVVGEQGRVLEGSHSAAQLLGVEPRALAGRPLDELLDGALPGDLLPRVLENKHVALDKIAFRHPDGTERVLDLTASRADVGIERILFVVLRDVTERTRALEALSESESRFRALVRSMNDVVFTTDTEARVTGLYGGAAGRGAGTAGDTEHPMLPSFERASTASAFRRVLAGEVVSFDWTSQREGQTFHTETTLSPLLGPSNEPAGVVGVSRDVSELRRAQTMMVFGDRLRTLGLLSAGLAHEINNPLAALVMSLDAMDDARTRGADMGEIVAEARAAASHVRAIVSDLRIFGRRDEPIPGPVDVERILDSAVRMAHHELRDRVRIARRYRSVPAALGTEAKLGQVFLNLLVNAAQAIGGAKKGGLVTLETTDLGDGRVAVDVIDD
ncbi:MAG TPA: PAS domain-containing protein, partial [Polyangiaceae bacterium]|nr:PAS domain-containing protein [Polyangiaceae bacterium]